MPRGRKPKSTSKAASSTKPNVAKIRAEESKKACTKICKDLETMHKRVSDHAEKVMKKCHAEMKKYVEKEIKNLAKKHKVSGGKSAGRKTTTRGRRGRPAKAAA